MVILKTKTRTTPTRYLIILSKPLALRLLIADCMCVQSPCDNQEIGGRFLMSSPYFGGTPTKVGGGETALIPIGNCNHLEKNMQQNVLARPACGIIN